ncbi:MAG TPA: hypothetical protein VH561_00940 [Micromonosporaceae bacterium]|jgi:hypothetical protein
MDGAVVPLTTRGGGGGGSSGGGQMMVNVTAVFGNERFTALAAQLDRANEWRERVGWRR